MGRGTSATTPPQAAKNGPNSLSQADNRPNELLTVDRNLYEAQTRLLRLVDDFMAGDNASGPIEVINDLLYNWLTMPTTDLINLPSNSDRLSTAFSLVNFLAKAYEELSGIQYLVQKQKEVSRG